MRKDGQSRSRTKTELRPCKCGVGEKCSEFHGGSTGQTIKSILEELDVKRELMAKVVKLKIHNFGHVARGSAEQLALTVLEGSMEGTCFQGKPRRQSLKLLPPDVRFYG